jgi:hypothetical protein
MLSTLDCHFGVSPQTLYFPRFSGGDDGARTRDLCRDSLALIGFSTTYRLVRDAEIITSRVRSSFLWVGLWVRIAPDLCHTFCCRAPFSFKICSIDKRRRSIWLLSFSKATESLKGVRFAASTARSTLRGPLH